jgi:hypothetical protein
MNNMFQVVAPYYFSLDYSHAYNSRTNMMKVLASQIQTLFLTICMQDHLLAQLVDHH